MKKTELVLLGLFVLSGILRYFHIPGAGIVLFLSSLILSALYFYLGFLLFNNIKLRGILKKESYKEVSTGRIVGAIGTGFALGSLVIGSMFKIQAYPGSFALLYAGILGSIITSFISLFKLRNNSGGFYRNILKRTFSFSLLAIFLLSIPLKSWLVWRYPNHPDYVQAVLEADADPDNFQLIDKVYEESVKMEKANREDEEKNSN